MRRRYKPTKARPNQKSDRYMGLGPYPQVTLGEARAQRQQRENTGYQVDANGHSVDPIDYRRAENKRNEELAKERARLDTFEKCAKAYLDKRGGTPAAMAKWEQPLRLYAYPKIGDKHPQDINKRSIRDVLNSVPAKTPKTLHLVRRQIARVLDFAKANEVRAGDNPAAWKGNLQDAGFKAGKDKHHAALPYQDIAAFMSVLECKGTVTACALRFIVLTAARSGEAFGARWDEFDLTNNAWTVPADRMKARRIHKVPLSPRHLRCLNR